MIDLHIELPKEFEENTLERFDSSNAKRGDKHFVIEIRCALCVEFSRDRCKECPIYTEFYEEFGEKACAPWVAGALEEEGIAIWKFNIETSRVLWLAEDDREAREQLDVLIGQIKKFVKWI